MSNVKGFSCFLFTKHRQTRLVTWTRMLLTYESKSQIVDTFIFLPEISADASVGSVVVSPASGLNVPTRKGVFPTMLLPRILLPVLTLPMIKIRSSPAHMSNQSASVKKSNAPANNSHGHISRARAPITHPHFPVKKHPQPKLFTAGSQSPSLSKKRPSRWTGGNTSFSNAED